MRYVFINDKDLEEAIKGCIESCYSDIKNKELFKTEVSECVKRWLMKKH